MANSQKNESIAIVGGGIVGLLLALSLKEQTGVTPAVYEEKDDICRDSGTGLIMFPNGLRVLRDYNPELLQTIRKAGHVFRDQRWERHDGTEVMTAHEKAISKNDAEISSMGIRRSALQQILFDAVQKAQIPVHFNKSIATVTKVGEECVRLEFRDKTKVETKLLVGADGVDSEVRNLVWGTKESSMQYSGVTLVMGLAPTAEDQQDLCFPSSTGKSHAHAVFFPTSLKEECFQLYFHSSEETPVDQECPWGNHVMRKAEFKELATQLKDEGWHARFWQPLADATCGFRVSFRKLAKPLKSWVDGRVVLIGDAAHPPVPYLGQGAQMGFEDVGVFTTLLKMFCLHDDGEDGSNALDLNRWEQAMQLYQEIRMKRAAQVSDVSFSFGKQEDQRCDNDKDTAEMMIRGEILMNGTLPMMMTSADHDYKESILLATAESQTDPVDASKCLTALEELMGMSDSNLLMSPTSKVMGWNRKPKVSSKEAKLALETLHGIVG